MATAQDILNEVYDELSKIDGAEEIAKKVLDALDEVDTLDEEISDLEDKVSKLESDNEDLEEQLDEQPEFIATFEGYEEIWFAATNFKDKEMIETLQHVLSLNITPDTITKHLQQLTNQK